MLYSQPWGKYLELTTHFFSFQEKHSYVLPWNCSNVQIESTNGLTLFDYQA